MSCVFMKNAFKNPIMFQNYVCIKLTTYMESLSVHFHYFTFSIQGDSLLEDGDFLNRSIFSSNFFRAKPEKLLTTEIFFSNTVFMELLVLSSVMLVLEISYYVFIT